MTSIEMQERFLILYDKVTNFDAPGYEDEEISILLTKAQERVFSTYYNILGNKFQEGFEATEARRKELKELVVGTALTVPSASQANVLPNGVFFDLPSDCLFAISEEVTLASFNPCLAGKRVRVRPITHDEYSININNPFKKPDGDIVWRLDYSGGKHELITVSGTTIATYHLRYVKRLTPIITGAFTIEGVAGPANSPLDKFLHERIIDEAVKIATAVTDPQQYQIKTLEQKEGE
jgi:hypothetical protein